MQKETPAGTVADSPTAVDFNVYDKAYEEEVERIQRSGGDATMYQTWHLGDKQRDKLMKDNGLVEGKRTLDEEQEKEKNSEGGMFKQNKFADLYVLWEILFPHLGCLEKERIGLSNLRSLISLKTIRNTPISFDLPSARSNY